MKVWKGRKLSLKGKITVINNLALPPLLYVGSIIHVPNIVFKEVKKHITDFIWDSKPSKIAYNVLIQGIQDGGLKLVDLETKVKSLKLAWVKRLLSTSSEMRKAAPSAFFNTCNITFYFECNQPPKTISPLFYQDMQNYWSEFREIKQPTLEQIKNEIIWNNRYITVNKNPILWQSWINKGVLHIYDLLDSEGKLLDVKAMNQKYNIRCNFLNLLQLRQAIPFTWRQILYCSSFKECKVREEFTIFLNTRRLSFNSIQTRDFYSLFIVKLKREPTCIPKWKEEFPEFNTARDDIWDDIFSLAFKTTRDTALQSFQYKLIHRLTPCQKKLFDMKISDSPKCNFCNKNDTLLHFFLYCPKVKQFWHSLFQWWNNLGNLNIDIESDALQEIIIFGIQANEDVLCVFNFCSLNAKHYIYKQRLFHENNVDFYEYLIELKYKLTLEKRICLDSNTEFIFEKYVFLYEQL